MRIITYITNPIDDIVRLMIYKCENGVFVFGYDSLADCYSTFDNLFTNMNDAILFCKNHYEIEDDNWISIEDTHQGCQDDWIGRVRIKGSENGQPIWGEFERLIDGIWRENSIINETINLKSLTVNERLYITGLSNEFERSLKQDKINAEKILKVLKLDDQTIRLLIK